MRYPKALETLISNLQKYPGVGKKTAERYSFDMLSWSQSDLEHFAHHLATLKQKIGTCKVCKALLDISDDKPCKYCDETKRDSTNLCILSSQKDLFAVEATHMYLGMYHVLDGLLSPTNNFSSKDLNLDILKARIDSLGVKEVILALDSTLEGDATSLYLKKELENMGIKISRLALGMPIGSSLDFIDEGTLSKALSERTLF
ncbi:MAG: Recombination protein RecR [Chlamydiia bacterium]|nr:Recombination protein RecR [Chlamydiia bacterium]